jgi:hypothetical protein
MILRKRLEEVRFTAITKKYSIQTISVLCKNILLIKSKKYSNGGEKC